MKKQEWTEGLDHLDPDLVEQYVLQKEKLMQKRRKQKGLWLRVGIIAACVAVIIALAAMILPMLLEDSQNIPKNDAIDDSSGTAVPSDGNTDAPIIFDTLAAPDKLQGNNLEFIVGSSAYRGGESGAPPAFQFNVGISVKARVVKNYPDKYYKLDTSSSYRPTAYRLIQMETLDVISGENLPRYFLYLIPEYLYVDMSVYDSLLISMTQIGIENYVLKNATKNQIESFELTVFADLEDHPDLGNVIAFSDGVFDESLWQNESWIYGYQFAEHLLENSEHSYLVVARGDSEDRVISAIKKQYDYLNGYKAPSVLTSNFKTEEAKAAMEYVKPFENGVFAQRYEPCYGNGMLFFTRYIGGCQTEEMVTINLLTEEVTYSEVRYTKEDIGQMKDISVYLSEKAAEYSKQLPTPPHTEPEGKDLVCLNMYAWYAKVDGKLYGVVKTSWWYYQQENDGHLQYDVQYYDDAYVLYDMSANTVTDISRDDLLNIVGERNVYTGEYGKGNPMPM